jgi:uncharacterized membrane protein
MSAVLWQTASGLFRGSIAWEYTLPLGVIVILAVGFALLLFLQWRDLKSRVTSKVRWGLCLLRGIVYVLVLAMLLNPTFILQKVLRLLPSLAVVVDTSGSMTLPDAGGKSRLQQAIDYLHQDTPTTLDTLAKHYQVKFYQFDETARAFSVEHLDQLQGGGHTTDITGSLTKLLEDNRATPPIGVLLFSDGAQHDTETGLEYLRQTGVPVVTVGLGTPEAYRDIRVASVQAPSLTFLHYPVDVHTTLQVWGYRGERIPVVLKREGRVVATQTVEVTEAQFQHQVDFEIVPEDTGEFTYTVSVAPRLGEALTDNNQRTFPISVVRDKIRVLLVCGTPTWNYRFLREALKQDPSVDMVSFVILRTPTDVVNVPENQLSLIPFPTRRLFTQELQNFDLIIFENFSFQLYFPWYYLENVRTYVNEGGAFAMLGGALSFAQGGYTGTPIEDILPVMLGQDRSDYHTMTQRLVLTPEGKAHPITRLSADPKENEHLWETMPELDALNIVAQAKPAATVLGVSSSRSDGAATVPLLAVQRVGKGRTLALMSDYIWKWNFQLAGQMDSNQYYLQFIRQLTRWLIRDPVLKQVRIMADATEFHLGSDVTGTIQILQDDYRPAPDAVPRIMLHTPAGAEMPVESIPTNTPGEFRYRFRADEVGLYSLDVQATIGAETSGADRILLRVYHPGDEDQQAAPNHVFLKHVAEQTGGVFFALQDPARPSTSSLVEFFGGVSTYKILEETRQRMRETLPLFCLLLVCLGLEWLWRRRAGLF